MVAVNLLVVQLALVGWSRLISIPLLVCEEGGAVGDFGGVFGCVGVVTESDAFVP